jgi:cytochrome P450
MLRVYPIVIHITKMITQDTCIIHHSPNAVSYQGEKVLDGDAPSYLLPKNCRVYLSSPGVHANARFWKDPFKIDPYRWMSEAPNQWDPVLGFDANPKLLTDASRIPTHVKGTMLTFSEGSRACVGKKFAQVELVAFFAAILRQNRFKLGKGEDPALVERTLKLRSAGSVTLSPPDDIKLVLQRRQSTRVGLA